VVVTAVAAREAAEMVEGSEVEGPEVVAPP